MFRIFIGLLVVLNACSSPHYGSKSGLPVKGDPNPLPGSKSGLQIHNGHYRGAVYTDSLGNSYKLLYIPITITNDTTIQVHLQIAFAKEYYFPGGNADEKFKVIPMPREWAIEGGGITDSMTKELKNYINKPSLNKTLDQGEKYLVAIGTLYPIPPQNGGIKPNALFLQSDKGKYSACDWLIKEAPSSNPEVTLGLKLNFSENCTIIPCGQISYPER